MKVNPILKRDMMVQSRSYTIPLVISGINAVLFLVGLLGVFGVTARMQHSAENEYEAFISIYILVVMIWFGLIVLVAPSLTAGGISGERQTKTMDLMLITLMKPMDIIGGKIISSLWSIVVMLISCIPAMMIPLLFGGVSTMKTILIMLSMIPMILLFLCIGIFASSIGSTSIRSTAIAYAITAFICIGTVVIAVLSANFAGNGNNYLAYMLVFNPATTILSMLANAIGEVSFLGKLFDALSLSPERAFLRFYPIVSILFQLMLSAIFVICTVLNITPKRK
ncbi:MAG: ABC transporter permease subunit [Eubacteriales bacterium]|nr:ABC transporter permease subunit [Eubacteriales bacterium]